MRSCKLVASFLNSMFICGPLKKSGLEIITTVFLANLKEASDINHHYSTKSKAY